MGVIFALGAGLCCLALGLSMGSALSRHEKELAAWCSALERMQCGLESLLPLTRVLGLGEMAALDAMAKAMEAEPLLSLEAAWEKCAAGVQAEEKQVLAELFVHLGQGDLAQRRQALAQAQAQISAMQKAAKGEMERSRPLWRSLGSLGGLALTLLLL